MARGIHISIKYKFLFVFLFLLLSSLSVFLYFAYNSFSEDKKLFVIDLNLSVLKAATSDVKLELKSRLEELQVFIPRIYHVAAPPPPAPAPTAPPVKAPPPPTIASNAPPSPTGPPAAPPVPVTAPESPYFGLSPSLSEEVLGITFFRRSANGQMERISRYENEPLVEKKKFPENPLDLLNQQSPPPFTTFGANDEPRLLNRSFRNGPPGTNAPGYGVLSILINGTFVGESTKELVILVDLDNGFLRRLLGESELAKIFLIYKDGRIFAHPSLDTTVDYANHPLNHPILARLQRKLFARESSEVRIDDEAYLCSVSETGFPGVFAVSQIKKREAFIALENLMKKGLLVALLIVFSATFLSTLTASRLTSNIRKLRAAAQAIGQGHLNVQLKIRSRDEVQKVAESFEWMASRVRELMEDTAKKALLEEELRTARLVQSTLLTTPAIESDQVTVQSHYAPASECGGDFWDAHLHGNILTLFIGDATGHGTPAALVTAVAKSCFTTLNAIYSGQVLRPEELLSTLNQIIHTSCRGKLLMTMCIIQLDLVTGDLLVCNAGHEAPLCQRAAPPASLNGESKSTDKGRKGLPEVLFARGERLGHDPAAEYSSVSYRLKAGDTLLLYTDGISEARNGAGKEWGERALKKTFAAWGGLSLNRIKQQMVDAVSKHTGDAAQEDDITFVLLRWNPTEEAKAPVRNVSTPPALRMNVPRVSEVELVPNPERPEPERNEDVFRFLEAQDDSREAFTAEIEIDPLAGKPPGGKAA